ncbi:hypothetical protein [Ideonella paludis]|uniref:Type II secretion system protein GspC N-terminal domain-containing protein n=1 Tax=Ideonella paludis TaxID=1233411 RepID=A0ABS5E332_9BURK|nr:hypothetical protein [Ideonella paludis]MBQ0937818.1 hypothetical protein [Ideonella paludis]
MNLQLKWLRVAVAALSLAVLGLAVWVWAQPRLLALGESANASEGGTAADRQRLARAKQLLSQVKAAQANTSDAELAEFLEQSLAPKPTAAASAAPQDLGAVDYASLNVGVMRTGKALRLVVGDESYGVGAKLPGGDVLLALHPDKAVIKRPSGRSITVKLDQ